MTAEKGGKTLLVMHELYPRRKLSTPPAGAADAMGETFEQLDELPRHPGRERGTVMNSSTPVRLADSSPIPRGTPSASGQSVLMADLARLIPAGKAHAGRGSRPRRENSTTTF